MHSFGSGDGKPKQKMTIVDCGQCWLAFKCIFIYITIKNSHLTVLQSTFRHASPPGVQEGSHLSLQWTLDPLLLPFRWAKAKDFPSPSAFLQRTSLWKKNRIACSRKHTKLLWWKIEPILSVFINLLPQLSVVLLSAFFIEGLNLLTYFFSFH